jgi:hypothetical protein
MNFHKQQCSLFDAGLNFDARFLSTPSGPLSQFAGLSSAGGLAILCECAGENILLRMCDLALWCNWLTRRPLKAESPGSSPGNATNSSLLPIFAKQTAYS